MIEVEVIRPWKSTILILCRKLVIPELSYPIFILGLLLRSIDEDIDDE